MKDYKMNPKSNDLGCHRIQNLTIWIKKENNTNEGL